MDVPSIPYWAAPASGTMFPAPPSLLADQRALMQAVKAMNATGMFGENHELSFILDHVTRQGIVRVVDRDTREVVRQIPAEYVLRLAEDSFRMYAGT
jgi:flagellar protein FlaG